MTLGIMATDVEQRIDFDALRTYKLQRVRDQLEEKDLGALLCLDMDNIRYLTSTHLAEWARDKSTQKQRDLYKQALEWLERSIEAVRPGATTADIAEQWPSAEELGYENEIDALGLQVGHGVVLSNHEKPMITRAASPSRAVASSRSVTLRASGSWRAGKRRWSTSGATR